jgi:hypothetical protein
VAGAIGLLALRDYLLLADVGRRNSKQAIVVVAVIIVRAGYCYNLKKNRSPP